MTSSPITSGIHHLGLTVANLEESAAFFTEVLGWREVGRKPAYPAIFISDGNQTLTLWQLLEPHAGSSFDRRAQSGLHHLALLVESEEQLDELHRRIADAEGCEVEFAPELAGAGPAKHLMIYEPSGLRIEFRWPGSQ
jgi:catechol 2,3-dioxygenase-like lactoylglutathione lyase family enzyme